MEDNDKELKNVVDDSSTDQVESMEPRHEFIKIPLLRGFTEIQHIYMAAENHGGIICGGYARYAASPRRRPEPASDVDIFPMDGQAYEELKTFFLGEKFEVYHENNVSLTLKTPKEGKWAHVPRVQLIKPLEAGHVVTTGEKEKILSNFDFTVVRIAIITQYECLADSRFLEDEKNRRLRLINIHCPVSSMLRCMKYARRGYFCPPSEAIKLFLDWENRPIEYRESLADMLKKSVKDGKSMSREDVEQLEALLRID